jgi:hypothetical protein
VNVQTEFREQNPNLPLPNKYFRLLTLFFKTPFVTEKIVDERNAERRKNELHRKISE